MKTCFIVGTRSMWMFLPTFAAYSATRTEDSSMFIRCTPPGTQMTGTVVGARFCSMTRSRRMISGLESSFSMVSSHMLTWYAESLEPEKYSTVSGRYSRSQSSTASSTLSAVGGIFLPRTYGSSAATYRQPRARVTATPTNPARAESMAAETSMPITAARSRWSIFSAERFSRRFGGAFGIRMREARSTLRVATGIRRRLRIRVTRAPCGAWRP